MEKGAFTFRQDLEDIHMTVESALTERIGEDRRETPYGPKQRNDQVALDMRLYLREEIAHVIELIGRLKKTLVERAKKEIDTVMPGYTHLQKAQPVLLSHYLLAYWEMFHRDELRLHSCHERVNVMPLGSAALAGTSIPIDRVYVAGASRFPEYFREQYGRRFGPGFCGGIHF